jgi:hypothetical protein
MQQEESLKKDLDRFLETAEIELSRLAKLLPDMEMEEEREPGGESAGPPEQQMDMFRLNHLINNLRAQLRKKDFPALSKGMDMARDALRKAPGSIPEDRKQAAKTTLKQLLEGINALMEKPAIPSSDEDKKNLRDLAHRQGLLKEQTEELYQKLNSLFQLFPSLNPKIIRNIHEAANSMGKARGWLSQLDPEEAIPPEQDALERLFQSSRQMQSSMQRLAQRGQLGRIPLVYLFRRGRFLPSGRLVPLPGIPKFPKFDVKGGVTGLDTEKFQLPGKEDYKVPRKFREQIMESLKQGVPNRFKEQIESYFKALSQ